MDEGLIKQKTESESRTELLSRVNYLLNDCSNEMSQEIVTHKDPNYYKYKVRGNWFHKCLGFIEQAVRLNYAPPEFLAEVLDFIKAWKKRHYENPEPKRIVKTTKEEIDTMDNFLKRTKEFIENK